MNIKFILVVLACLRACSVANQLQGLYDDSWTKLNTRPVCFESKNNRPGIFRPRFKGFLAAVKLVHLSGQITCDYRLGKSHYSNWGCHSVRNLVHTPLNVFITDMRKRVLFPKVGVKFNRHVHRRGKWYSVYGFDSRSKYLVLQYGFSVPLYVGPKSKYQLWYGEDLLNYYRGDNRGRVCADVYGYFL